MVTLCLQLRHRFVFNNGTTISTRLIKLNKKNTRALTCAFTQIVLYITCMDHPYQSPDECPWDPDYKDEKRRKEEAMHEYLIDQLEQDHYFLRR